MKQTLFLIFFIFNNLIFSQSIKGNVKDVDTKKGIENVNIYAERLSKGTTTNKKGKYTLDFSTLLQPNDILVFSFIGYATQRISYSELKNLNFNVALVKQIEELNTVNIEKKRFKNLIRYKELVSNEIGLSNYASYVLEDKLYVFGGDATYVKDAAQLASLKTVGIIGMEFEDFARRYEGSNNVVVYSPHLYIYNFKSNAWEKSDIKFRRRAYHTVQYHNGKFYLIGGKFYKNRNLYLDNTIEVFNLKDQSIIIDNTSPLQTANPLSFFIDNTIIVMGGSTKEKPNGNKVYTNNSFVYDINSGFWYELKKMLSSKSTNGAIVNNKIYLFGGSSNRALDEIESYNLSSGDWNKEGLLFEDIKYPAVCKNNNTIYIYDSGKFIQYDISTSTLKQYSINLFLNSAQLHFYNQTLYIYGGYEKSSFDQLPSAKLYSIDTNEFHNTKAKKIKTLER